MPLKLLRRGRVWYLRGTVRQVAVYESTGTADRALAREILAAREREIIEGRLYGERAVRTFADAALSYLEVEQRSPSTAARVRRLLDHWAPGWHLGTGSRRGWPRLAQIDQAAVDRCLAAVLRPGAKAGTRARMLAVITAVLRHAARRNWCDEPRLERIRQPRGRTAWLSPAEASALLAALAPHLRPLCHFVLCTGARLAEAIELDWRDVRLTDRLTFFRETKTGRDRLAHLPDAAVVLLANLPADPDGCHRGRVFRRPDGKAYADKGRQEGGQIKTGFRGACRRAGLGSWSGEGVKRRFVPVITPHDLRHTWATWFYALSRDPLLLKAEGGWQTLAMVERYAHLMPAELAPQIAGIWGETHPRLGRLPIRAPAVQGPGEASRKRGRGG